MLDLIKITDVAYEVNTLLRIYLGGGLPVSTQDREARARVNPYE